MFTELLEKIKRVKEVLDELQMALNNDDRTIYEPM
jgi:flagellin-specific chaperone FliS